MRYIKAGLILLLLVIAVQGVAAQEVSRDLPNSVELGETFTVTISASSSATGVEVIEEIPQNFTYKNYTQSDANKVEFTKDGNQLTFTVTDLTAGDGFTISYNLTAPQTEDDFSFSGTYNFMDQSAQAIGGDKGITISVGEIVEDNVDDSTEKTVSKYNQNFSWQEQAPDRETTKEAVTNAVNTYFSADDEETKTEVVNDVTKMVTAYFKLEKTTTSSNFKLLVSDAPADISDFEHLNVTLSQARVFKAQMEGNETENETDYNESDGMENETEAYESNNLNILETNETGSNETDDGTENDTEVNDTEDEIENNESDEMEDNETEGKGFEVISLNNKTVDLTQLVGENTTPLVDTNLETGTYTKVELYVQDVVGVLNNNNSTTANVMVPSEKLQITKPFEIRENETTEFVFDINVVKKGSDNDYNLLPVISESGVVGKHINKSDIEVI